MAATQPLQADIVDKGGLKRDISFQVPSEVIRSAMQDATAQMARSAKIPGFRPGRVPASIIRSRYGEEIKNDILQKLIPDYYQQAIDALDLRPATSPLFSPMEIREGENLTVCASLEVLPAFTLQPYQGMPLKGVDIDVTAEDIAVAHRNLQESMAMLEPRAAGEAAQTGDQVVIDFAGSTAEGPVPNGASENFTLDLGAGRFIPGFEEQVAGHKAGETFSFKVTFPADYHADVAGKEATFEVTLREIRKKILPEVDDAFAAQLGDFATVAALDEVLKEQILARRKEDLMKAQRQEAFHRLGEAYDFAPPESLIEDELQQMLRTEQTLIMMRGENPEQVGFDPEKLREQFLPNATIRARVRLVISEIARAEKVTLTERDYEEEFGRLAREYNMPVEEVRQRVTSARQNANQMTEKMVERKVLELIVSQANVSVEPRAKAGKTEQQGA